MPSMHPFIVGGAKNDHGHRHCGYRHRTADGDCLSYAVPRLAGEPLLFAGENFGMTDIARP